MGLFTRRSFVKSTSAALALTAIPGGRAIAQDGDKPTIVVGSLNYTEQFILAQMMALKLEEAGYPVERKLNLGGTAVGHEALVNGEIDMYPEYTGSALAAILNLEEPETEMATASATPAGTSLENDPVYQLVKAEYAEQFDLEWLPPFGFNNTWAMCVTDETAAELGLEKTSDLEPHAGDMTLGTDQEFPIRPDGLPGFEDAYGFGFGDVTAGEIGLMYSALDNGDVDVITAYTTDGRIPELGLTILEDDLGFFPPYHNAPVVRMDTLEESPEVREIISELGGQITTDEMAAMNLRVDEEGVEPIDAARDFLVEQGLLGSS